MSMYKCKIPNLIFKYIYIPCQLIRTNYSNIEDIQDNKKKKHVLSKIADLIMILPRSKKSLMENALKPYRKLRTCLDINNLFAAYNTMHKLFYRKKIKLH